MKKGNLFYLFGLVSLFILSGCVVRTYNAIKDRVDQDLSSGNRGYLQGLVPQGETRERKATRTTRVVEVELGSPIKFEKAAKKEMPKTEPAQASEEGNRGYITGQSQAAEEIVQARRERYTVQKNDTLQKISQKFYGTTKKWTKIYDANKEAIKGPNKIYPGQVIDIPLEEVKEGQKYLK